MHTMLSLGITSTPVIKVLPSSNLKWGSSCCRKANQKAKNDDEKMPVEVAELNDQTDVIAILKGTKTAETTEKEEAKAT